MKKTCIAFLVLGLILLGAAAFAEADLTLLVYMCGADLQSAACEDIYEMGVTDNGEDVNIVILAGGATEWDFDEIKGGTRNLLVIRDGDFESISDWGWASMGSEESLREFLAYGLTEYPASRTAVILWDHGAGSEAGVCFDETTEDQDGLSLLEINQVLNALEKDLGGFHIDIFGCDACMMATYEMAALLSRHDIDYYIASEELEPGTGWNYTPWLEAVEEDPGITTEALCGMIVDSYMEASLEEAPDDYLTLSAIDLKAMAPLQDAMEAMGAVLMGELEQGNLADVRRGRSRMYSLGAYVDGSWDMVDMGMMLDTYARFDAESAAKARKALAGAVMTNRQENNLTAYSGLSVLIPHDTKNEFETYSEGLDISFYIPNWIGFVKSYTGLIAQDGHSFSPSVPESVSGTGFLSQVTSALGTGQEAVSWNDEAEAYEEAEPSGMAVGIGEGDYAFSASVTQDDLRYLDYVEGMLMMDISDEETDGYVDLGLMQNNVVDWNSGEIYSLFDGTWPILGEQLVPLYDQIANEYGRRSLIPVKLNGEYTYLVVEFKEGSTQGRILGANAGYDENGLPIRETTALKAGDRVVPVYTLYIATEDGEDYEESEFDGDEIIWEDGLGVTYEALGDDGDGLEMMFCFVLNDVFGEYDMTEVVSFEV